MKIEIVSDIHLDFWVNHKANTYKQKRLIKNFINNVIKISGADILVIAGDLGHYNSQNILFLEELTPYYKYILLTWGNHDLYLVSKRQESLYKTSFNRLKDFKNKLLKYSNIYFLDGDLVEIENLKIWGSGLWYKVEKELMPFWIKEMNDASFIKEDYIFRNEITSYGKKKIYKFNPNILYKKEIQKLNQIDKVDIIITHIPPILLEDKNKIYNFYFFNGEEYLIKSKYWFFGHLHKSYNLKIKNTKLISSPLGYPKENKNFRIKLINV